MKGFRKLGDPLFSAGLTRRNILGSRKSGGDTTAPTATITALSAVANVVAMQIVWSEAVTGFVVGDITISAGGSLASFATVDNITFTVSWTLAEGGNTFDIAAGVCQDAAGNNNLAASQFTAGYFVVQPDETSAVDTYIVPGNPGTHATEDVMYVGELNISAQVNRALIKPDLSALSGKTILSARYTFLLGVDFATNTRIMRAYRQKRAWTESASGTKYDGTNNWQVAGGFGADDCEQTDIGSVEINSGATGAITINLNPSKITEMANGTFTDNGIMLKMDTESDDGWGLYSSAAAVAAWRPMFSVVYYPFDLPVGEPDFTVIHIPDTQEYTGYVADPPVDIFQAMTQWIANNRVSEKIGLVLHTGDIVIPADDTTWNFANSALTTIESISTLPILYCPGNHDYDGPAAGTVPADRPDVWWNTHLGQSHYTGKSWWSGGFFEEGKSENAYLLVTLGGVDYIILALEFGPRQAAIDWANTILTTYSARDAIIITHSYMYHDGAPIGGGDSYNPHTVNLDPDTHDGEEMWTELVKLHSNIVMVLGGHNQRLYFLQSIGNSGNIVTQILDGHHDVGDGKMLVARFYLSQNKILYTLYSPYTGAVARQDVFRYKAS